MAAGVEAMAIARQEWFGHPRGLYVLFATEMWERFSFYGMRALLIFYLTKHFLFSAQEASHIYGAYLGMVYALPVVGGLIADRWLGFRKSIVLGGVLLSLGHLGMAVEGEPAEWVAGEVQRDGFVVQVFYLSLGLIIAGVGFLKPNISSAVGQLYAEGDPRRDGGFTIFYMGINLGAFLSSLIVGGIGEAYGWRYGFGLAGIGMLIGLCVFLRGQRHLEGVLEPPRPQWLAAPVCPGLNREWAIYLGALALTALAWFMVQRPPLVGQALVATLALAYGFFVWHMLKNCTRDEQARMTLVILLTFCGVCFWALFEQAGSSMNLFTDEVVDRNLLGWEIAASQFQSLNAGFILLLGLPFAALWAALGRRGREPGIPAKFGLGIMQAGLGFGALVLGIAWADDAGKVAMLWIVLAYLLHTTGELCLSPVGLSMVTKLTPARVTGMMMGAWFLATAFADYVSGVLAGMASVDARGGVPAAGDLLRVYGDLFELLFYAGTGFGALVLLASPWLKRLQRGVR